MKIIFGCEESQTLTKRFRAIGHEAYSCDLKPCSGGHPEWHFQEDIFAVIEREKPDVLIAHPPCTYLAVTANRWLKDQPARKSGALVGAARRQAQKEAIGFAERLWALDIPYIVIENPIGVLSTQSELGKPSQIIQPWQFGHREPKKTCLWIKGLPLLTPTSIVEPEYHLTKSGKRVPKWFFYADKSQGQAKRAEIRSKTFDGVGDAMAEQWGGFLFNQNKEVA